MKKILLLLITALVFSCSDDDNENAQIPEEPDGPSTPTGIVEESTIFRNINFDIKEESGQSVFKITETIKSDTSPVEKTETYTFNHGQLVGHSTLQEYYPQFSMSDEKQLDYSENIVTVTDGNNNVLTYTLNDEGYAVQCKYQMGSQIRFYNFQYSANNYLTRIEESIGNTFFSSLDLSYENEDLISVTTFINDMENTILYEPGEITNSGKASCFPLSETYPISTHSEALYAGLLGKMSNHLVTKTQPKGNDDEWTNYQYSVNESGNISSIRMSTHHKGVVFP